MNQQLSKEEHQPDDRIKQLENDILALENELQRVEAELNAFEAQIRSRLQLQILKIRELTALYKQQKQEKKEKRLEQKKRGKNYKEPKGVKVVNGNKSAGSLLNIEKQQELKRLYKEAIVLVHPDKFVNQEEEKAERATAITVQLNAIYKSGNLEELNHFYEHILSGNAMSHVAYKQETIVDPKAMLNFLQKKKKEMMEALEQIQQSHTYSVLTTYEKPLSFIDELREEFDQRIKQLEKRTRINKKR